MTLKSWYKMYQATVYSFLWITSIVRPFTFMHAKLDRCMYYLSITRDSITKNRNFGAGCILVCHLLGLDFEDFHPVRNIKEFDYFKIQQIAVFRFLMKYAEEVVKHVN